MIKMIDSQSVPGSSCSLCVPTLELAISLKKLWHLFIFWKIIFTGQNLLKLHYPGSFWVV